MNRTFRAVGLLVSVGLGAFAGCQDGSDLLDESALVQSGGFLKERGDDKVRGPVGPHGKVRCATRQPDDFEMARTAGEIAAHKGGPPGAAAPPPSVTGGVINVHFHVINRRRGNCQRRCAELDER